MFISLVPRPVWAIRVSRGGLEPSAIARGLNARPGKKVPDISLRKSYLFCDDHGIFLAYETNTSLPSMCGPFHPIATKCGGRRCFFHKHWWVERIIKSLVRYTKLEKSFFGAGHGTIVYTSINSFISIQQSRRGFLSLQGYSGLILPLLFELLVGKNHENHLHSFGGKAKKT